MSETATEMPVRVPQPAIDPELSEPGQCTVNADYAAGQYGWRYVEGYAQTPDHPGVWTPHAWCVDAEGCVIDPTWTDTSPDFIYREAPDPFEREVPR